jgi:hypothetical protein
VETATQTLHRLTSIDRAFADSAELEWTAPVDDPRVVQGFEANDLDRFPWFYKRYGESFPRLALPRTLPSTTAPAVAVLAGTADVARAELDLSQLARLLHLSAGVVRTTERPYTTWLFRASGSAGGRFPLELYVAIPEGNGVPAGVHWYDPREHALVQVGPPPRGEAPTLVVTGVPWRTGWRYRERGYRHVYWDAGTMLGQLLAVADSAGLIASLYSRYPDDAVAALVGADGVHEWPVAVVALGDGPPSIDPAGAAAAGEVDRAPMEFPLVTAALRAGDRDELYHVCWEAGLARDASFVVIAATNVGELDDREYRDAHLAAGVVMGRLHLLAYGLGASASGMTFVDSEVPALLDESMDGLLFTCIGVPDYASSAGGPPGAPVPVRMMEPRS